MFLVGATLYKRHDVWTLRISVRITMEENAAGFAASCGEPPCSDILEYDPVQVMR
jgi:hypothetical protein